MGPGGSEPAPRGHSGPGSAAGKRAPFSHGELGDGLGTAPTTLPHFVDAASLLLGR